MTDFRPRLLTSNNTFRTNDCRFITDIGNDGNEPTGRTQRRYLLRIHCTLISRMYVIQAVGERRIKYLIPASTRYPSAAAAAAAERL